MKSACQQLSRYQTEEARTDGLGAGDQPDSGAASHQPGRSGRAPVDLSCHASNHNPRRSAIYDLCP